jgi:SAM-dependent methyltransferase
MRKITARYALAVFLGSALLFLIEPIAGKRVLPLLGGSAAVWTACLVFFQTALLLGYFVAHWLTTRVDTKRQSIIYLGLLALSLAQLFGASRLTLQASSDHPIASVLWLLTLLIGLPFVTLSASGPLLQSWYARSTDAPQPYQLYAVSNVGSLLALLAYPWLLEPRWSLGEQTSILIAGVLILIVAAAVVAIPIGRSGLGVTQTTPIALPSQPITAADRILWISLSAIGSLLLSSVTNYISQNIATLPLMWIVPLVAYLLSFVVAFSDERWRPRELVIVLAVLGMGIATYRLYHGDLFVSIPRLVGVYCTALFLMCVFCHSELYHRRPAPARLTEFYFLIAAGGALGAMIVGVIAPMVLHGNYELVFGLVALALLAMWSTWSLGWIARNFWFAAAIGLAYCAARFVHVDVGDSFVRERNFYGTLRVSQAKSSDLHAVVRTLYNGVIEHGQQVYREDLYNAPTTYYGTSSGVGLALNLCCLNRPRRVGVIGLGTGTIAAYGKPGDVFRFYDINPAVERVARGSFTYLRDSKARVEVVIGDARVSLASEGPQRYDVLAVDAFSGDAIPVHLITSEALEVYKRHLAPGGVVAFHVSNRHLNLAPVVQQLADHGNMKAVLIASGDDTEHGVSTSDWVLVTNNELMLDALSYSKDKEDIKVAPGLRRWTDDYNSLLPILRAFHPK